MPSNGGRPKGAGNLKYRNADHGSKLEMARLRLADPDLSILAAAKQVAPSAAGYQGDEADFGKTARRLYEQYRQEEQRYVALATPPPPQRRLSAIEMAARITRQAQTTIDWMERAERARIAFMPKLPKPPNFS